LKKKRRADLSHTERWKKGGEGGLTPFREKRTSKKTRGGEASSPHLEGRKKKGEVSS